MPVPGQLSTMLDATIPMIGKLGLSGVETHLPQHQWHRVGILYVCVFLFHQHLPPAATLSIPEHLLLRVRGTVWSGILVGLAN